jgi:competence protein ComEC
MPSSRLVKTGEGAGSRLLAWVYTLRQRLYESLQRHLPAPESELLAGILLGIETGIPDDLAEDFKATGTAHIIAISGFNIALLAGLFTRLFSRLAGPRRGLLFTLLGLAFYTVLAGASASVVRAAVMGSLGLYGRQIGRRQTGVNSLTFTALVMCLINPNWLWDIGFQLSFMATLGLILYAGPLEAFVLRLLQNRFSGSRAEKITRFAAEYFLLTFAAQITTLPLMAYHFGRFSWTAFLVNPLILPVQPAIMAWGGAAALLGLISQPLAIVVAAVAWPFTAYTVKMVELWAQVPGANFYTGQSGWALVLIYYSLLLAVTLGWGRARRLNLQLKPALLITVLAAAAFAIWQQALAGPSGLLKLEIMENGERAAILVHTPGGRSLLIGGGDEAGLAAALGERLPLFGPKLDGVLVSQPEGLLRTVSQYSPEWVLWMDDQGGVSNKTRRQPELVAALDEIHAQQEQAISGHVLDLENGAELKILEASGEGQALLLSWQRFSALILLGSASRPAGLAPPSVLVYQPAGDRPVPVREIGRLEPGLVILLGKDDAELTGGLEDLRTIEVPPEGWLRITTDGQQMWLDRGR